MASHISEVAKHARGRGFGRALCLMPSILAQLLLGSTSDHCRGHEAVIHMFASIAVTTTAEQSKEQK